MDSREERSRGGPSRTARIPRVIESRIYIGSHPNRPIYPPEEEFGFKPRFEQEEYAMLIRSSLLFLGCEAVSNQNTQQALALPEKEVIQPHLPVRLPCYDFTPVTSPAFGIPLLAVKPPTDALRPIIPDNACILCITAAAGTELADAYSPDTVIASSPGKEVHDPWAFYLHAALLRQAFAHCGKFPTAASRRSLGRVSVPVWLIILSDQLLIIALGRLLHSMLTPARAGFLGSPFPPRSRPGWPASGSGNSPVPWSKTWLDAGSTPRGACGQHWVFPSSEAYTHSH
nr:hypothetical protein C5167_003922 [Ipomoea trifida]